MEHILQLINGLSPFSQSMLGSAIFVFSSFLARFIFNKIKNSSSKFLTEYSKLDVVKHTLHKEYVNSSNIQLASYGASIALLQSSRWVLRCAQIFIFFFGVSSIVHRQWLYVAAAWFCFNCILEALSWVKDSSNEKHVSHVPEEIKQEIYESLRPKVKNEQIE